MDFEYEGYLTLSINEIFELMTLEDRKEMKILLKETKFSDYYYGSVSENEFMESLSILKNNQHRLTSFEESFIKNLANRLEN